MSNNRHKKDGLDYSWVTEKLAIGGFWGIEYIDAHRKEFTAHEMLKTAAEIFDVVVLCAAEIQPKGPTIKDKCAVVHMPIEEHLCPIDKITRETLFDNLPTLSQLLAQHDTMLCCCLAGLARSPLVAASLLKYDGMSGKEACELVYRKRHFSNFSYIDYVCNGDDDYEARWVPTFEERRKQFYRNPFGRGCDET